MGTRTSLLVAFALLAGVLLPVAASADVPTVWIDGDRTDEATGLATVTVRGEGLTSPVAVRVVTAEYFATEEDYEPVDTTVNLTPSAPNASVDIRIVNDDLVEDIESFWVNIIDADGTRVGSDGRGLVVIHDGSVPALRLHEFETDEPDVPTMFDLDLQLSAPDESPVRFTWEIVSDGLVAGKDYTDAGGDIVVAPGDTRIRISVELLVDEDESPDERLGIQLTSWDNLRVPEERVVAWLTLRDREQDPPVTDEDAFVPEADTSGVGDDVSMVRREVPQACGVPSYVLRRPERPAGSRLGSFGDVIKVELDQLDASAVPDVQTYVRTRIVDGTAALGRDVQWQHHDPRYFAPDERVEVIEPWAGAGLVLRPETIAVGRDPGRNLWFDVVVEEVAPRAVVQVDRQRLWVLSEELFVVWLEPLTPEVDEGDTRGSVVTIGVRLSEPLARTTTLDWAVREGTAVDAPTVDVGTVTVPAGATRATFTTTTLPDRYPEGDDVLRVSLVGGADLDWIDASTRILVRDDDVDLAVAPVRGGWTERLRFPEDSGVAVVDLAVLQPPSSSEAVIVDWTTQEGSARANQDFRPAAGNFTVPAGAQVGDVIGRITVPLIADGSRDVNTVSDFGVELRRRDGVRLSNPDLRLHVVDSDVTVGERDAAVARVSCGEVERSPWSERTTPDVTVLAGDTRDGTSVAVSRHRFPDPGSVDEVLIASGLGSQGWADALAGAPLAARLGSPLLLVSQDRIPDVVTDEIGRVLRPGGRATILGGPQAVQPAIESAIAGMGYRTRRIAGEDRVATSLAIAEELGIPGSIMVATGAVFADALTAGAAAAAHDGVVLLTSPETGDARIDAYLRAHSGVPAYGIGGPAARAHAGLVPVVGADRSATSVAVADRFFDRPATVGLARGDLAVDALAAGPLLAAVGAPLLLATSTQLPPAVDDWICTRHQQLVDGLVFGGPVAVNDLVRKAFTDRLRGECTTPSGSPEDGTWYDRVPAPGVWEWDIPPTFWELPELDVEVTVPLSARLGEIVPIHVEVCNRGATTIPIPYDRFAPGGQAPVPSPWYHHLGEVSIRTTVGYDDTLTAWPWVDNRTLFVGPGHALQDGLQPDECVSETATWDQTLRTNAGVVEGMAAPGRWQVQSWVELGSSSSQGLGHTSIDIVP